MLIRDQMCHKRAYECVPSCGWKVGAKYHYRVGNYGRETYKSNQTGRIRQLRNLRYRDSVFGAGKPIPGLLSNAKMPTEFSEPTVSSIHKKEKL